MVDTSYTVKVILNKHIPEIHSLKSEDDIRKIVDSITDIIKICCKTKSGTFYDIFYDLYEILSGIINISKEKKIEIIKDILDYIMNRYC